MSIRIVNLPEFRAALAQYMRYTRRDMVKVINTKAFYVARGAVRCTQKTPSAKIRRQLMQPSRVNPNAPLAAILVNAVLGGKTSGLVLPKSVMEMARSGKSGLYGPEMQKAVKALTAYRQRTRGFIAAGFLPSVAAFEPLAERKSGAPKRDRAVKQYGRPKGRGIPARQETWIARAVLINAASAANDRTGALDRVATDALRQAVEDEIASMAQYIRDTLQKTANQHFNSKHS